ncbi:MAG: DUF3717 domain-containing protein [Pseudomonadota bacterium]
MDLSVQELEAAINYWREQRPIGPSGFELAPEVNALAVVYALMIYRRASHVNIDALDAGARAPLERWRANQTI